MIYVKTAEELEKMRVAATLVSKTLGEVAKWAKPGVTTLRLDTIAREFILDNGGRPSCLGYQGFPGTLCIEVNETVVHGFPSGYVLRDGDIVGTDCVVDINGFHGDSCYTFPIGEVDEKVQKLLQTTYRSLYVGIEAAKGGKRVGDISNAIQTFCERRGYSVVREMCGHGIGASMHEDPQVPNYGRRGCGAVLRPGMCIAIEPMINLGSKNVVIEQDGWTCRTRDRKPSAHYEHTVIITDYEPEIITTFEYIEANLSPETLKMIKGTEGEAENGGK